ncbi:MAG: hypothetical protein PVG39_20930, partial [Desulfobacteraceae bacterium]
MSNITNFPGFWQGDPFEIIRPEEYELLGIDPSDIPPGTVAAHRHPPLLSSRYGGNAYGFGFFEIYSRLNKADQDIVNSIDYNHVDEIKSNYREINNIYKRISLLIRFSSLGKPYYLIPTHMMASSLTNIKSKADEISKIIKGHQKKYLQESHRIGILTHMDDPIVDVLTLRFKEHEFVIIDSQERLRDLRKTLDIVIITWDLYKTVKLELSVNRAMVAPTKSQQENYIIYTLDKIYKILKPDGELFVVANRYKQKTNRRASLTFKSFEEQKNFLIFTHIYKTGKKYSSIESTIEINTFDFEKYLEQSYLDQEHREKLLKGKNVADLSLEEINDLPYLNIPLTDNYTFGQEKSWMKLMSIYFDEIFFKSVLPDAVKTEWDQRFDLKEYTPDYLLICLAQKREIEKNIRELKNNVSLSPIAGSPLALIAEYRDSFAYLIRTLKVLKEIKNKTYSGLHESYLERIREPFESKKMRYGGMSQVIKLIGKINRLEKIRVQLNPDNLEGFRTKVFKNLEILNFYGFSYEELREICLIIAGHTTGGRIIAGKMSEKTLKPITDLARTYNQQNAINLLRYCRLMTMAEIVASRRTDLDHVQVTELFDLFESALRITTNRDIDWERLLDEKISDIGGSHNKLINKLFMMMKHFQFIDNWHELSQKGEMEKESLADYDDDKLAKIENIIALVKNVEHFEEKFLSDNPLQRPVIFRKFLNMEFHGTGHLFERLGSKPAFILLWFTVNVTKGNIINFNPILGDSIYADLAARVKRVEEEAIIINTEYLSPGILSQFTEQLYENKMVFVLNTGFKFYLSQKDQSLDITYIDIDSTIESLDILNKKYKNISVSDIPLAKLEEIEKLLTELEDFYQSHQRLVDRDVTGLKIPGRQTAWVKRIEGLRQFIRANFKKVFFKPGSLFDDLERIFHYSPTILNLVLPELNDLRELGREGNLYRKSAVIDHLLICAKKFQALIKGNLKGFQDVDALHKLARREFGPNAAGIVGLNESQIEELADISTGLKKKNNIFDALIKTFILQDIGMSPALREKYKDEINTTDQAQAGVLFLQKENIPEKYGMDCEAEKILLFLIKHHDRLHHIVRGEYTLLTLREILDTGDADLFNAFFLCSVIMISALGEDQILEDLASRLFILKELCLRIINGETSLDDYLEELYWEKGRLFFAVEEYHRKGIPENETPSNYLSSWGRKFADSERFREAGKLIFALERFFKLRGLRYIDFQDLSLMITHVPLQYIYQEKKYSSVGYATFEKDLYEALRTYNYIRKLPEAVRHFILRSLSDDRIRLYGFENVSIYLSYDNLMKLLLLSFLGAKRFKGNGRPVCLSYLNIIKDIERRYEAVNDALSRISFEDIWYERKKLDHIFRAKTGIIFEKDEAKKVLFVNFKDDINMPRRITRMENINDVDQLKSYFHYSLQFLRKNSYYTDDYEALLESAYEKRFSEIIDIMLEQIKKRMMRVDDFREVHAIYTDLVNRSLEIGFREDQLHRLNDLYELHNDSLKRTKLEEINSLIKKI